MPEYQDDVLEKRQAKKEKYDDLINSGGLSASVGWPITRSFHFSSKVGNEYW